MKKTFKSHLNNSDAMQKISKVLFFFVLVCIFSCAKDSVDPVDNSCGTSYSYTGDVKLIIDQSCAYSGCHDGVSGAPGNYTTFDGMSNALSTGVFENRVVLAQNMPPDYATDGPTELTVEELTIVTDWVNAGFPEEPSSIAATYESSIRTIIDNSCAYSGCHDGQSGVGNYTFYDGMVGEINEGDFFTRVVTDRDVPSSTMPPPYAVEEGGEPRLTEEEFELMLCWIENGYPEN